MSIKKERDDLEKLIQESRETLESIPGEVPPPGDIEMRPAFQMDFAKTKRNCKRRARGMINRATGLLLSDDMVKDNPYLRNKMQMDVISLTGILYQLEINEMMQETLMEEVRSGVSHPRMFEVFGNLSKTIGDLNKQLLQTIEAIKVTYRDTKNDIIEKREELKAIGPSESSSMLRNKNGLVTMGTKDLIREANKIKNMASQNVEDIEEVKGNGV